jgi:fructose-bisphosphate aldolase class I
MLSESAKSELNQVAKKLVSPGKGILAADESTGSIKKRFDSINLDSTPESHRLYRQLLFTVPNMEKYISGVIMFDETVRQKTDSGIEFPKLLSDKGVIPGIKVDMGLKDMPNFPGEKITEGIDGLGERLIEYKQKGLKFTKWRALMAIGENIPSDACIISHSDLLARYAALVQEVGLVPIVEPEVLMEGKHTLDQSKSVLRRTLKELFIALERHKVYIPGLLLKSSWAHPGKEVANETDNDSIAKGTMDIFNEVLPDELPGVVFLSGGDSPENSTSHLAAINNISPKRWPLSFSFGRALQEPVLRTWQGKPENTAMAQKAFYERAELNGLATTGKY